MSVASDVWEMSAESDVLEGMSAESDVLEGSDVWEMSAESDVWEMSAESDVWEGSDVLEMSEESDVLEVSRCLQANQVRATDVPSARLFLHDPHQHLPTRRGRQNERYASVLRHAPHVPIRLHANRDVSVGPDKP